MNEINGTAPSTRTNIDSFINHPVVQTTKRCVFKATIEAVSIVASHVFLCIFTQFVMFPIVPRSMRSRVISTVIIAPVHEEILFRLILQGIVHLLQKFKNRFIAKQAPNLQSLKAQEVFRVRTTAFLFGCIHLLNPHTHILAAAIQFSVTTFAGLSYGYLAEKYKTISLSILAHGFSNALACGMVCYANKNNNTKSVACLTLWVFQEIFMYKLGTCDVIQNKFNSITKSLKNSVANMADNICKRLNPPIPVQVAAI
ncbi:MAG: CPBP family intramembrane metalloprotease [Parachlamydiaceae bacterium]|nr:CPBP family intramembrane metalloprotease [Parachlamydiaceae bacterium]